MLGTLYSIYTFLSTGFVMMKVAEALLLSLTIVQPHSFMQLAQAVALNCCLLSYAKIVTNFFPSNTPKKPRTPFSH